MSDRESGRPQALGGTRFSPMTGLAAGYAESSIMHRQESECSGSKLTMSRDAASMACPALVALHHAGALGAAFEAAPLAGQVPA